MIASISWPQSALNFMNRICSRNGSGNSDIPWNVWVNTESETTYHLFLTICRQYFMNNMSVPQRCTASDRRSVGFTGNYGTTDTNSCTQYVKWVRSWVTPETLLSKPYRTWRVGAVMLYTLDKTTWSNNTHTPLQGPVHPTLTRASQNYRKQWVPYYIHQISTAVNVPTCHSL